jgi:4-hydroxy-tetrahydrodipicolinate synthase
MVEVAERRGANAVMMVTPYYAHFNSDGMVEYFRAAAGMVDLPLILYNIPSRTGVNLTPEDISRLVEVCPSLIGIKECSSDLGQVSRLIASQSDRLSILCGEEYLTLPELVLGAGGAVLASANLIPSEWVRIYQCVQAGRIAEARTMYFRLLPLLRLLFSETNPGPLKEALTLLGIPSGPVALPLQRPALRIREQLATVLDKMGLISKVRSE